MSDRGDVTYLNLAVAAGDAVRRHVSDGRALAVVVDVEAEALM